MVTGRRNLQEHGLMGLALVLPAMLVLVAVVLYPLARGIYMSFHNVTFLNLAQGNHLFVGFQNYLAVFAKPAFWTAVKNSAVWTVANLVLQMALGLGFALLLNQPLRGRGMFRSIALIPWIVPSVVAVLTWRWMYDSGNGILNHWLMRLGVLDAPVNWLGSVNTVLWSIIAESVWKGTPFVMVLLLAGLQSIQAELYEAAQVDGARNWHILGLIILPLLKRHLAIAAILTVVYTLNNFNAIWLMTQGGPLHASEILVTYAYKTAFQDFNLGQASAIAVIIFIFLSLVATLYISVVERGE